jgi:inward rectifier potassium channel
LQSRNRTILQRLKSRQKEFTDSGLSNQVGSQTSKLLGADGKFRVTRTGQHAWHQFSILHELFTMSWGKFIWIVITFYIGTNMLFALAYFWVGMDTFMGPVVENKMDEFMEAFFFSAQTITTVGYGRLNPVGVAANILASLEALIGLLSFSIVTGLVFGRFSRPVANLVFSQNALFAPFKDSKALMFRLANSKNNDLTDVQAQVLLVLVVYDGENFVRKYYNLELERQVVNALALSWTVVHPITEDSPLYDMTPETMEEMEAEVLVTIKGFDTTFSQTVIGRTSYHFSKMVWNARFIPAFYKSEDGGETILDLQKLHEYTKLDSNGTA